MIPRHQPSFDYNGHQMRRPGKYLIPKISFALINLSYTVVDGEGDEVKVSTWAVGASAKVALRRWLDRRPDLSPAAVAHTIVTESKAPWKDSYEALGARVEVSDPYLEATG